MLPMGIYAQEMVTLSGRVTDKATDEPLPEVVVTLRKDGKTIKFARTSTEGYYNMQFNAMLENAILHFSMMGFAATDITIAPNQYKYDVQLEERETKLKEVVIKAPNIRQRGDTVVYNVSRYASVSDKSLADVLKKMPGIEVSEKGEIKYNGVSINKFYIEGHDMLGGKYGLATNNLHHGDVSTVEVIENHQPIKALEDISFSQQPAINIRLKESAKKRLVGTMKIGSGIAPELWRDELTLMRFSKKTQTLNVLKTNNTGDNILNESSILFSDISNDQFSKSYKMTDFIDVSPDRLADLDEYRVRRNQSHSVNLNNLWSLGKSADLGMVVSYGHDRLLSDSHSSTAYLLPDSTIVIDEGESSRTHHHEFSADLTFLKNTKSYYITNKLLGNFNWNNTDIRMLGSMPNVQSASVPNYKIQDNFELLKRSGNRTYTLNSYNTYQVAPHNLEVSHEGGDYSQNTRSISFYTNTNTSLGFSLKPVTIWLKTGIIAMTRTMSSEGVGIPDSLGSSVNKTSVTYLDIFVSPIIELKTDGFNAKLEIPMAVAPYYYQNKLNSSRESTVKLICSPLLYMQYYLSSSFYLSLTGQIAQSAVDEQNFYDALIMNNYRSLSLGLVDFNINTRKSATFGWSWKEPIQAFFANMSVTRLFTDYSKLSSRLFGGNFIISSSVPQSHTGRSWVVSGSISKGLDFINGLISVSPSYICVNGQMSQNNRLSLFSSRAWFLSGKIRSKISNVADLSYDVTYTSDEMLSKDTGISNTTNSLIQCFTASINFTKQFYLTLRGEYYNNQVTDGTRKHMFLGDISLSYCLKSGWEFTIEGRNFFNQKTYAYTAYSDLVSFQKEYTIRPRNIIASIFFHI